MRFSVLGPVGVMVDGRRVSLGRGHERTILAMLLAADGQTIGTDSLIEGLWAHAPPVSARKTLQSHLSRLRRNLRELAPGGSEQIQATPEGYHLVGADEGTDADQFSALLAQARQPDNPHESLALFEAALEHWHGAAFGDLADHPAVIDAAQQLERLRRSAIIDRAAALLTVGRFEDVTAALGALITEDPYNERAHAHLMRALAAAGHRAEALSTFEELRSRLRDDLGVDPADELRGLHEQMLRQDTRAPPPSAPTTASIPSRRNPPLLGRTRDVEELSLALPKASLLTLTGSGGVGKTTLAEHLVERTGEVWHDGVMRCALAHIRDHAGVSGALITALSIQSGAGQTLEEALVAGLGERHLLVFLDNCEHVLPVLAPLVQTILSGCPNVTVLATSRERLRLPAEQVWPVAPLDLPPKRASCSQVLAASAGHLFHARAEAIDPTFALQEDNAPAVAELCRRLDGIPLAIELAAARVRALSPQDLAERLDQRFAVLTGGPVLDGGRHRTLEAVVTWSYDLLDPAEADLFDRLAIFAGAVPLAAIEAVCADEQLPTTAVAGLLGELVDKSMVVVERGEHEVRYRLLETMRDFGMTRLVERGLVAPVRQTHATYYLALAETEGERARGAGEAQAVQTITAAMDDLRAAHAWALTHQDLELALRIPGALPEEVAFRLRDEVTTWARRALAMPGAENHPVRPYALTTSAWGGTSRDECERAVREATWARQHLEPDHPVALAALRAQATAALYQGRLDDVLALADADSGVNDTGANAYHRAFLWICYILAHLYRGDLDAASAALPAIHASANRSGSPTMRAFAHYCQGEVHLEQDPARAAVTLSEAVRLGHTVANRLVEGVALVCLATSQGRGHDPTAALSAYQEVVRHWRRAGDHTHQLTAVRNLVTLLARIEAPREAALLYGAVTSADTPTFGVEEERLSAAWEQLGDQLGETTAQALAAQGRRVEPRQVGDEALAVIAALLER